MGHTCSLRSTISVALWRSIGGMAGGAGQTVWQRVQRDCSSQGKPVPSSMHLPGCVGGRARG